jgi:hypothetical protein
VQGLQSLQLGDGVHGVRGGRHGDLLGSGAAVRRDPWFFTV